MDALRAAIHWRYGTCLDSKINTLIFEACNIMSKMQGDIGIAFAKHRFNDAGYDDSWLAVRLGNFSWENGTYFNKNETSLRSAPAEVHELLGLLAHLQSSGIESAFEKSYGYVIDALDVFGLFRQNGIFYFACCNSQASCGPVYQFCVEHGQTKLYGFTDRFDWNFNQGNKAGELIADFSLLEIVTIDEIIRCIGSGEIPKEGPPHDMEIDWQAYLPEGLSL